PHRELLKRVVLERGRQQREQGKLCDAAVTLEQALPLGATDLMWSAEMAQELARCGNIAAALGILDRLTEPEPRARLLGHAVDHALTQGDAGRDLLPEELRPTFDTVRQAFDLATASRDDEARAALQTVGLHSPFVDW